MHMCVLHYLTAVLVNSRADSFALKTWFACKCFGKLLNGIENSVPFSLAYLKTESPTDFWFSPHPVNLCLVQTLLYVVRHVNRLLSSVYLPSLPYLWGGQVVTPAQR